MAAIGRTPCHQRPEQITITDNRSKPYRKRPPGTWKYFEPRQKYSLYERTETWLEYMKDVEEKQIFHETMIHEWEYRERIEQFTPYCNIRKLCEVFDIPYGHAGTQGLLFWRLSKRLYYLLNHRAMDRCTWRAVADVWSKKRSTHVMHDFFLSLWNGFHTTCQFTDVKHRALYFPRKFVMQDAVHSQTPLISNLDTTISSTTLYKHTNPCLVCHKKKSKRQVRKEMRWLNGWRNPEWETPENTPPPSEEEWNFSDEEPTAHMFKFTTDVANEMTKQHIESTAENLELLTNEYTSRAFKTAQNLENCTARLDSAARSFESIGQNAQASINASLGNILQGLEQIPDTLKFGVQDIAETTRKCIAEQTRSIGDSFAQAMVTGLNAQNSVATQTLKVYGHMALVLAEASIIYAIQPLIPYWMWCALLTITIFRWLQLDKLISYAAKTVWSLISSYFRYETTEPSTQETDDPEPVAHASAGDILVKVFAGGLLAILMKKILDQEPGKLTIKKFIDSMDLSFKINRSMSVIPQLLNGTTEIIQSIVVFFAGHNMTEDQELNDKYEELKDSYALWGARVSELSTTDTKIECERNRELRAEILRLRDEADIYVEVCLNPKWPAHMRTTFQMLYKNLQELADHVKTFKRAEQWRIDPWCIWIFGKPRVGKSFLSDDIIRLILQLANQPKTSYYARGESEHWDNYTGQFVTYWDDFGQWKGQTAEDRYNEFIACRSNHTYITKQADLKDKGRPFESGAMVMTSNSAYPDASSVVHCIPAVYMRRHLLVEAVLKPEFLDIQSNIPDTNKIFTTNLDNSTYDHLTFNLWPALASGNPIVTGLTYDALKAIITEKFTLHYDQQCTIRERKKRELQDEILAEYTRPKREKASAKDCLDRTEKALKDMMANVSTFFGADVEPVAHSEDETQTLLKEYFGKTKNFAKGFKEKYIPHFKLAKLWNVTGVLQMPMDLLGALDASLLELYYKMLQYDAKAVLKAMLWLSAQPAYKLWDVTQTLYDRSKTAVQQRFRDSLSIADRVRSLWTKTKDVIKLYWTKASPILQALLGIGMIVGVAYGVNYLHNAHRAHQTKKAEIAKLAFQLDAIRIAKQVGRQYAHNIDKGRSYVLYQFDPLFKRKIFRDDRGMHYVQHEDKTTRIYLRNPREGMASISYRALENESELQEEIEYMTIPATPGEEPLYHFVDQFGDDNHHEPDELWLDVTDDPERPDIGQAEAGGVSGDARTSRQTRVRVLPRSSHRMPVSHSSADTNLDDQMLLLRRHMYIVHTRLGRSLALATNGHNLLLNSHVMKALKQDEVVELIPPNGVDPIKVTVNLPDIVHLGTSDVAIWRNLARVFPAPAFSKKFIREQDLPKYQTFNGVVLSRDKDSFIRCNVEMKAITQTKYQGRTWNASYGTHTQRNVFLDGWYADFTSTPGTCGALWFAEGAKFERKIVGMHIAGFNHQKRGAFAAYVTQEEIESAIQYNIDTTQAEALAHAMCISDESLSIIGTGYETLGRVSPKDASFAPTKTTIRKAKTYGLVRAPVTEPAILTPRDPRNLTKESPFRKALTKYEKRTIPFSATDRKTVSEMVGYVMAKAMGPCSQMDLTLDEVVNGLNDEGYKCLDMDSSPGYSWKKLRPKGTTGKTFLFEDFLSEPGFTFRESEAMPPMSEVAPYNDCTRLYTMKGALSDKVWTNLLSLKDGNRPGFIWEHQLKDERRPLKKIKDVNTRIFTMADVDATITARALTLPFTAAFYKNTAKGFSAVGIDTHSAAWGSLMRDMARVSNVGGDGDYGRYDGTLDPDLIMEAMLLIARWQREITLVRRTESGFQELKFEGATLERALMILAGDYIHTYQLVMDCLHRKWQGNPSGNCLTVVLNTIVGAMYLRLAFAQLKRKAPRWYPSAAYEKFVKDWIYGDDNVLSICPDIIEWFNPTTISEYFATHGIEYTTADKSGIKQSVKKIKSLRFLKRGWRPDEADPRAYWDPIDTDTIFELTNWIRESPDEDLQLREQFGNALYEAAAHGLRFYRTFLEKCNDALEKVGILPFPDEYQALRIHRLEQLLGPSGKVVALAPACVPDNNSDKTVVSESRGA